ncbi:MAG: c-type cytochrome [Proteobacteria bacterium]|jgi:cytochrome c551/c552/cytochrome c5|nr:c-type cytochrome [Pseudomonadota bacterium]MBK8959248.1 c-type cytochrome [Pseudomonadota bacterium]
MSRCERLLMMLALLAASTALHAAQPWHTLGRPLGATELASWDIDVRPDGAGLPPGSGSVADGQLVYDEQCASCHGFFGESNDYLALTGGIGSLASNAPQRTVGSKLDHATTLWDYINRAMPFPRAKTLSADQVYAVTAYVLNLNEILPADAVLDAKTLPQVKMPNREGFTLEHGFMSVDGKPDVHNSACMKDCIAGEIIVKSSLPDGFAQQMYGDLAQHFRDFKRGPPAATATPTGGEALAQSHGCLACHALEQARVGPAFRAVAKRYAGQGDALAMLTAKLRAGGAGNWGSVAMPAQTAIGAADLELLLKWVLASGAAP